LYVHPYTMEVRASSADVLHAQAYIAPAGEQDLWDMQIEQANHYISYGGIVHRNCGFDEVTEIREESYRYLFSRLRKPGLGPLSEVPLRMRCASNPAPNWVRQRFIVEGTDKGRVFVPSGLEDNPGIDVVGYRRMLSELDLVERQRLEFGDWWATQLGSMFAREDFTTIDPGELPHLVTTGRLVRFWDLAATEPSATNPDPDWTVGTLMLFTEGKTFILDVQRIRKNSDKVEALIRDTATEDGKSVAIRFEREPGSAGKALADQYARYVLPGFDFAAIPATGDKETRARPFASAVANGNVYLVRGKWNTEWLDEVTAFPVPNVHDDQVDSAVGAYIFLTGLGGEPRKRATLIA
jgi:predicted phage terminase large subunit-like protein